MPVHIHSNNYIDGIRGDTLVYIDFYLHGEYFQIKLSLTKCSWHVAKVIINVIKCIVKRDILIKHFHVITKITVSGKIKM